MSIVENIKKINNNLAEIERKCGLSNSSIRKWDIQSPSIKNIKKVADELNVTIDYIITGKKLENQKDIIIINEYLKLTEMNKGKVEDKIKDLLKDQEEEKALEQGVG